MNGRICAAAILGIFICSSPGLSGDNPRTVFAVRVTTPPKIDGVLDDSVWQLAAPATDFIQRDPQEGKPGSEKSEVRVLYDDDALYFGCMYYDREPEKIVARLARRDDEVESDEASIRLDSYHDHQTGYEFTYNAAGVKIDKLQFDDANKEDDSWDPVWEVKTAITPRGWVAEIRIPFRILHYRTMASDTAENIWGINLLRYISRRQEDERWAFTPKSESGFISRYGHLRGLRNLHTARLFDALPFLTGKQSYDPASTYMDSRSKYETNLGLDLKYGLSSNFLLDATINPDFGQVEADPSVLNLSTFETFYPEKRPFFIEGTQFIHFSTFGGTFGPGMFYSRRIGRAISEDEVSVPDGGKIDDLPKTTTIYGAAKLSGKTNGGLSVGALEAVTKEERATVIDSNGVRSQQVLEPLALYNVIRLKQDILENSNVGMIFTITSKDMRYPAITNGYDWNVVLDRNTYSVTGFLALSRAANAVTDRGTGSAGKIQISRIAGEHWLWSWDADYTSRKYNIDDVGFFFSPNDYGTVGNLTYKEDVPAALVRNYSITGTLHIRNNFDEANIARQVSANGGLLFANYWQVNAAGGVDAGLYDPYETRGNGLYTKPHQYNANASLSSDQRENVILNLSVQTAWDSKRKDAYGYEVGITTRPVTWMQWGVDFLSQKVLNRESWVENAGSEAVFGDRSTNELSFTLRGGLTFTRDLTLQIYFQQFLAKGHYDSLRVLVGTAEFAPNPYEISPDFNRQSFNSNVVLRWEYLPGSTLYLVWSQARSGENGEYFTTTRDDLQTTFDLAPSNVFLLKISYLLSM